MFFFYSLKSKEHFGCILIFQCMRRDSDLLLRAYLSDKQEGFELLMWSSVYEKKEPGIVLIIVTIKQKNCDKLSTGLLKHLKKKKEKSQKYQYFLLHLLKMDCWRATNEMMHEWSMDAFTESGWLYSNQLQFMHLNAVFDHFICNCSTFLLFFNAITVVID